MMAFEPLFYFALATIALGNGLFLPSLPSQINDLYAADDPRRGLRLQRLLRRHEPRRLPRAAHLRHARGEFTAGIGASARPASAWLPALPSIWRAALPAGRETRQRPSPPRSSDPAASRPRYLLLLLAIGLAVTVFRGSYEQVGNTVALVDAGRRRPRTSAASRSR